MINVLLLNSYLVLLFLPEKAEQLKVKQKEVRDGITEETARINGIPTANEKVAETISSLKLKAMLGAQQMQKTVKNYRMVLMN